MMIASTLRIAWRNLGRNARRTVITGFALAVGTSLSVAAFGLTDGMNAGLLDTLTRYDLGHAQIHRREFPRTRALGSTIDDPEAVLAIVRGTSGVVGATPRAYTYALVGHDARSLGAELVGVDPRTEPVVTRLDRQLVTGAYLPPEPTPWPRGRALTADERALDRRLTEAAEDAAVSEIENLGSLDTGTGDGPGSSLADDRARELALAQAPPPAHPLPAFVGAALAKNLHVAVGGELHATGQAIDGTSEQVALRVVGVFATGTAAIDRRIYLHIGDLQRFTHLGTRVHEIALSATSPGRATEISRQLSFALVTRPLVVRDWRQIRPDIGKFLELEEVSTAVMIFIILFVATLGVVNTMLMAVFERTRELGVLKAIGMSGLRIVGLIVAETTMLVIVASTLGTGLGLLIDWYMVRHGVDLSAMTSGVSFGGVGVNPVIYGAITEHGLVLPAAILAATCFVASFYPAVRAARMRPAIGMRDI